MMKYFLKLLFTFLSTVCGGKIIGFLDYCRTVVCDNMNTYAGQIHYRMSLSRIIPDQSAAASKEIEATDKIKVRILYPAGDSWNNIHTLYEAFVRDMTCQTVVIVPNEPKYLEIMENVHCRYIDMDHYDVRIDMPDIFIATYYSSADDSISFPGCRDYIGRVFAAIPNAVMNEKNRDIHWKYVYNAYKYLDPDYYIVDRLLFNGLKGYVPEGKLIEMGNPQFDEIFNELGKERPVPDSWKKLKDKKVFLWATDHGINESYPTNGFTVDLYLGDMLRYFSDHTDVALIFRPHPQFIREMLQGGHFWNMNDILHLKEFCEKSANIVWDDSFDFCRAYDTCDAIMVDLNCSITCSALTTGKPICRLKRYDIDEWMISPELTDCYYYAASFDECVKFIDMIKQGHDEKALKRVDGLSKAILHFDGQNGSRMKKFILEKSC